MGQDAEGPRASLCAGPWDQESIGRGTMNQHAILKVTVLLLLVLAGVILFFHFNLYSFFVSPKKVVHFVNSFGPLSVVIFIGIQILQVIVAPIPGECNGFIGGYPYGSLPGGLFS